MQAISHTDLILNPDGSIYHLKLLPDDIADTIILVGDPGRVGQVSSQFDQIDVRKSNREFETHTGLYNGKRMTVLSTGIGTDNIDIVLNELDALVNVDLHKRSPKEIKKRLRLIRIGTSGALQREIPIGATIITQIAGGLDGLYHFYEDNKRVYKTGLADAFMAYTGWKRSLADPYFVPGSQQLIRLFEDTSQVKGITLSTPGFYAPQLRSIRLRPADPDLIEKIGSFTYQGMHINNFEMESSALYALSAMMGHDALTLCVAIANRISKDFLEDYKTAINKLIRMVLEKLTSDD